MTYDELKSKAKWFDAPRNWGDTDEEILANIKVNIQLEASKQYINLLTNVDLNVRTTTKDLLDFIKTGMKYYKCEKPELTDESLMSKLEKQWEDYKSDAESWAIYHKQERKRAAARARYDSEKAKNKYETVTKPRMQAKKQEVIEQKLALLHEYKEKYGVECKFIYVHSPYDPHHRFVVPASEGQVVSFFAPDGFDRVFYDKAMRLVELLNELTATYGKGKVQKKGSLPKEGNQKLQKLLDKIGIARQWQGIYSESQRHYLDDRYKNEVPIG